MEPRTKIVATIGPASESPETLRQMVAAGMNMARLSAAHGPIEETLERARRVRLAAQEVGANVGVLVDLPGPKIRVASFPERGVYLNEGDPAELVVANGTATSDWKRIAIDHPQALHNLKPGDRVSIGDGGIELRVEQVFADRAAVRVQTGGRVMGRPGVALPAAGFTAQTPTAQDLGMLDAICKAGVDAVAVSFVRSAADIERVRAAMPPLHSGTQPDGGPMLVAKIETQEAVDNLEEVVAAADGVMVARGDLGIRCSLEDVPHYQKQIIRVGVAYARPVITATQMLDSMIHAPVPTRAEVSDVANAVLDGTSAVMLSGETAIGHDPRLAVRTMARIASRAEREFNYERWGRELEFQKVAETRSAPAQVRITAAISAAAWRAASDAQASAIIACTNTGATAKAISRFRPRVPVLAATPSLRTARQLSVAWGITPVIVQKRATTDDLVWFAVEAAVELGVVKTNDVVAVLAGLPVDPQPATDVLRLVRIY